MVRVLIAGLVAMVLAIVIGPTFIEWLRRVGVGQQIRLASHVVKQGTPTMGGLLILATAVAPFLVAVEVHAARPRAAVPHDRLRGDRVHRRLPQGAQAPLARPLGALEDARPGVDHDRRRLGRDPGRLPRYGDLLPDRRRQIDLGWFYFPFLFIVIAGTANGVNLTDGIDGLAAGSSAISLLTFLAIAAISWIRSGEVGFRSDNYLDVAIFAAAMIGGVIGFLWFNAFPAELFMGDTGSLALGGAIAGLAVMTQTEVLLIFIGGIYLIEALSVMIQVASFKSTGKRVFLITPIHHHFEMKAWSETKIMVRFWILGAIFCSTGFVLFYRYYLRFKL